MERQRAEHHHHQHHHRHHNLDHHSNYDSNNQITAETSDTFSVAGGFRFNGRKRANFRIPDYIDGSATAKLYVAPVPRTATEEDIRPLFDQHGRVVEVVLPRDKWSGQLQGYCFVKYASFEEADRAISALQCQYTFPGEVFPINVRYADRERERPGAVVNKLYVGSLNKQASKQEIQEIFSPYGHVEDVYIVRDDLKQSRGCAFVKFSHIDMALAAIKGLNGTFMMRGCDLPLIVRFADPKKPRTGEFRQAPNLSDSMEGHILPHTSYSMAQISTNSHLQSAPHITKLETAAPCIAEPLPSAKPSPPHLSQLQHVQASKTSFQSSPLAVTEKQMQTQNLEKHQQQCIQIPMHESPWTGSNSLLVGGAFAEPAVHLSPLAMDPEECDWSEHACPDGYKYYYNCTTCESRWDKPEEFTLFQQRLQKQQKPQNSNQQPYSLSPVLSAEEVEQTQKDLTRMPIHSETSPIDPTHV